MHILLFSLMFVLIVNVVDLHEIFYLFFELAQSGCLVSIVAFIFDHICNCSSIDGVNETGDISSKYFFAFTSEKLFDNEVIKKEIRIAAVVAALVPITHIPPA